MLLIRPRLNDYYDLPITQEQVDFAIPFLDDDIPPYVDPFLLWKSPSLQDNSLHTALVRRSITSDASPSKGIEIAPLMG